MFFTISKRNTMHMEMNINNCFHYCCYHLVSVLPVHHNQRMVSLIVRKLSNSRICAFALLHI